MADERDIDNDGSPLEQYFESSGKKQSDLGSHCGVSQATVSRWVSGQPIPDTKLEAVSKFTGIPVARLRPDLAKLFREDRRRTGEAVGQC